MLASKATEYLTQALAAVNGSSEHRPQTRPGSLVSEAGKSDSGPDTGIPHLRHRLSSKSLVTVGSSQHRAHATPSSRDSTASPQTRHFSGYVSPRSPSLTVRNA